MNRIVTYVPRPYSYAFMVENREVRFEADHMLIKPRENCELTLNLCSFDVGIKTILDDIANQNVIKTCAFIHPTEVTITINTQTIMPHSNGYL